MEDLREMCDIMSQYVELGFMQAVKAYEPTQDELRQSELKGWMKMNRVDARKMKAWIEQGLVRPYRKGEAQNSPLYYSKAEIKEAMANTGLAMAVVNRRLKLSGLIRETHKR